MVATSTAIQEFSRILSQYSTKVEDKELEGIVRGIDKLRKQNPAVYDEKSVARYLQERSKALSCLVEEYFVASIANKFPLISDELFQLKRYFTLQSDGKTWTLVRDDTEPEKDMPLIKNNEIKKKRRNIEVPLFVHTPLFDGKHTAKLGSYSKPTGHSRYGYIARKAVNIEAKLPGSVGQNLKEAYRDALSHYFKVLSEMFTDPIAGDVIYAEGNIAQPEIRAIWIPSSDSLNIAVDSKYIQKRKAADPAMILSVQEKNYLVKTWKVDEEEPFENYLREFSISSLKGKLKK
jgi:hypothetical protein